MNFKKYWKTVKNTGKVREICQSEKVGTMYTVNKIIELRQYTVMAKFSRR